jgi:hypothetical protein
VQAPTRRVFFHSLLTLAAALPARRLLATPAHTTVASSPRGALAPYLDTLIPADSTASATQLGADQAILALAQREARIARLVDRGCAWLDQQAGERGAADFVALPQPERDAVVALAEASPAGSLPRAFFAFTEQAVFAHYYAQPESWRGLGFAGPPQPLGFPDFAEPPQASDA